MWKGSKLQKEQIFFSAISLQKSSKKNEKSQNAARKQKVNKRAVKTQAFFYLWQTYNNASVLFTCFVVGA